MPIQVLKTAAERFIDAIVDTLNQTQGPAGYGLFIDDNNGRFKLVAEPLVPERYIVEDTPTTTVTTATIESIGSPAVMFDIQTQTALAYDGNEWGSATGALYTSELKGDRMYFNPTTQRVYYIYSNLSGQRMLWNP